MPRTETQKNTAKLLMGAQRSPWRPQTCPHLRSTQLLPADLLCFLMTTCTLSRVGPGVLSDISDQHFEAFFFFFKEFDCFYSESIVSCRHLLCFQTYRDELKASSLSSKEEALSIARE